MPTPTDIVNIGLRRIGADRIGDLQSDSNKPARVARDIYQEARRELLSAHTWNFAAKRTSFDATVDADTADTPTFGWDYAYNLPEDFLRMVSVHPGDSDNSTIDYKLEFQEDADRVLLCNANKVYIKYVFDLEDMNAAGVAFRDALAWRLAREFAGALSKSTAAAQSADAAFRRALAHAKAVDGIENYPTKMDQGDWVRSRFSGSDNDVF